MFLRRWLVIFCSAALMLASGAMFAAAKRPLTITLKDAIMLALRNNPDLESAELDRITQKFALVVAENEFEPQISLTGNFTDTRDTTNHTPAYTRSTDLTPEISLKNHYGTTFTLSNDNPTTNSSYVPTMSLTITQPLIKGFGRALVDQALNNALDTEATNKLQLKAKVIDTIDAVMNDYFAVMQAKQQLQVDKRNLENNETLVKNDRYTIAAGETAASDIYQDEAQVASAKASIQNQLNILQQSKLTLLKDLGLPPTTEFNIPAETKVNEITSVLTGGRALAPLPIIKKMMIGNNIQYQVDGIGMRTTRRALISARDELKPQLDLTGTFDRGGGARGMRSLSDSSTHSESVKLDLTVPIDDVKSKSDVIGAKIALEQAEIAYQNERRTLEVTAMTDWKDVQQRKEQLVLDNQAAELQNKTYEMAKLKRAAGKISSFELIKNQEDLKTAEQTLVNDVISYLQSLETLNKDMGITLDLLGIKIRY